MPSEPRMPTQDIIDYWQEETAKLAGLDDVPMFPAFRLRDFLHAATVALDLTERVKMLEGALWSFDAEALYLFLLSEYRDPDPTHGEAVTADVRPYFNALCNFLELRTKAQFTSTETEKKPL